MIAGWGRNASPVMLSGSVELVGEGALADDHPVAGPAEDVDEALHQGDVGGAQAAQREVDQGAIPAAGARRSAAGSCHVSAVARTHEPSRCQVGPSGVARR